MVILAVLMLEFRIKNIDRENLQIGIIVNPPQPSNPANRNFLVKHNDVSSLLVEYW